MQFSSPQSSSPMNGGGNKPTKRRRRPEERPNELVASAFKLFTERGYAATSCSDVAKLAGVSKGTLFLYFQNKELLFKAVAMGSMHALSMDFTDLLESHTGDSAELLQLMLKCWSTQIFTSGAGQLCSAVFAEAFNHPILAKLYSEEMLQPIKNSLAIAVRRGIVSGEFKKVSIDEVVQVLMCMPLLIAAYQKSLEVFGSEQTKLDKLSVVNIHLDLLLNGIRQTSDLEHSEKLP